MVGKQILEQLVLGKELVLVLLCKQILLVFMAEFDILQNSAGIIIWMDSPCRCSMFSKEEKQHCKSLVGNPSFSLDNKLIGQEFILLVERLEGCI